MVDHCAMMYPDGQSQYEMFLELLILSLYKVIKTSTAVFSIGFIVNIVDMCMRR